MKNRKLNAVHVWKQLEDLVVPRLHLSVHDRAVYSHLLRHSRLEGRLQLCFSIPWLARGACLTLRAARRAVRGLVAKGALRLAERSRAGHVVKVRLPEEIRSVGAGKIAACADNRLSGVGRLPGAGNLEKADFLETRALRQAIHAREGGRCFYCLRRLTPMVRCWTMWFRASEEGAMATATWCLRVRNVTRRSGSGGPRIFSAGSAARGV